MELLLVLARGSPLSLLKFGDILVVLFCTFVVTARSSMAADRQQGVEFEFL